MMKKHGKWYTSGGVEILAPDRIRELDDKHGSEDQEGVDDLENMREDEAPAGETKAEAFVRLARNRTRSALERIRLIGNLSNTGSYEYTEEQVSKIEDAINAEVSSAMNKFRTRGKAEKPLFDL